MPADAITVLMPVYNAEAYLAQAVDSILAQTFTDFELLVINDGSTDGSAALLESYTDPRIRVLHNPQNLKLIATLNRGIPLAKGKYIVRMDADDIALPDRLQKQWEFMETHPEVGICGTWYESFDETGTLGQVRYAADHDTICLKHLYQMHLSHGTAIIRKEVLEKHALLFDPSYTHAEDYELFTRMAAYTRLANLPFVSYRVRHHADEVSKKFADVQKANSQRVRLREFNRLGVDITTEQLAAYIRLAQQEYTAVQLPPTGVEALLADMLRANRQTRVFPEAFLNKTLTDMWWHYCYHTHNPAVYQKSELGHKLPVAQRLKWWLKSFVA